MIKHAAAIGLVSVLWAGPAMAQSAEDLILSNPPFGEDLPPLSGPALGVDEPLLDFRQQDGFSVRGRSGDQNQTIRKGAGSIEIVRDRNGRLVGYVTQGAGGTMIVKDRTGRFIGRLNQGPGGQLRMVDRNGKISGFVR